jgi:hypothetical protein
MSHDPAKRMLRQAQHDTREFTMTPGEDEASLADGFIRRATKKPTRKVTFRAGFMMVAGTGFEPVTFGL